MKAAEVKAGEVKAADEMKAAAAAAAAADEDDGNVKNPLIDHISRNTPPVSAFEMSEFPQNLLPQKDSNKKTAETCIVHVDEFERAANSTIGAVGSSCRPVYESDDAKDAKEQASTERDFDQLAAVRSRSSTPAPQKVMQQQHDSDSPADTTVYLDAEDHEDEEHDEILIVQQKPTLQRQF